MSRRIVALRAWRLAAVVAVCWLVHVGAVGARARTAVPLTVREVQALLPEAAALGAAEGPLGTPVLDARGASLGHAASTSPSGDAIVGYAGPTEALVVVDTEGLVVGVRLRRSADTAEHVAAVSADARLLGAFAGRPWRDLAGAELDRLGVDGVAGATRTSAALVAAVGARLGAAADDARAAGPTALQVGGHDLALLAVTAGGLLAAFSRRARRFRRGFQILVVAYLGLWSAEFLALALFVPWLENGLPWRAAPGLVALAGVALLVPWATGRSVYCAHVCPHGAVQEWLGRLAPRRWRIAPPRDLRTAAAMVPGLLLAVVLVARLVGAPLGLSGLEAFDAWTLAATSLAAIAIAVLGLVASACVPMAYCRYGCPTGALLSLLRTGRGDRLGCRDAWLLGCVLLAAGGAVWRDEVRAAIAVGWPP